METIEEQSQSKCEISITNLPSRICLVGATNQDTATVAAAESFGIPVIFSETGLEMINDNDWRTHFILSEFEGPIFEAIHKTKQCILGPPALKYAADMKYGLGHNTRPIYNYSMRGVVTCFTGIRKKDELTRLVNLIHSMGGCIKKDLNTKTTHLICNHSGGEKYQYAKTFRLTVVRPAWVYAAWEQRDMAEFNATNDTFSKEHKLKAFEGQKICFFGFPAEEQQHMVDVLIENGGVPAELDDPECSHVVMPNAGAFILSTDNNNTSKTSNTNHINNNLFINKSQIITNKLNESQERNAAPIQMEVDDDVDLIANAQDNDPATTTVAAANNSDKENKNQSTDNANDNDKIIADKHNDNDNEHVVNNDNDNDDDDDDDDDAIFGIHFDERLVVDVHDSIEELPDSDDDDINIIDKQLLSVKVQTQNSAASTPKSAKCKQSLFTELPYCYTPRTPMTAGAADGVVITENVENDFQQAQNLSPILKQGSSATKKEISNIYQKVNKSHDLAKVNDTATNTGGIVHNPTAATVVAAATATTVAAAEYDDVGSFVELNDLKRKRDSFDNVSLMSIDSFALPASTKKPKLIRTGSITRTIKRSMSFVADRTPLIKTLRTRRSSIAAADASTFLASEADDSICSLASVNSTFNESIRKPVKEKLRNICGRITRSSSKKDKEKFKAELIKQQTLETSPEQCEVAAICTDGFKTPKAPATIKFNAATSANAATVGVATVGSAAIKSTPKSAKRLFAVNTSSPIPQNTLSKLINQNNMENCCNASTVGTNEKIPNDEAHASARNSLTRPDSQTQQPPQRVVDEHSTLAKPEPKNHHTHILKSDWFWYTIQNGFANETDYLFGDYLDSIANTPNTDRRDSLPISFNKRKRKRFSQRLQLEGTPLGSGKRRSSVSDAGLLSVSGSFFDCTTSPDKLEHEKLHVEPEICETTPVKKSMRFNHFMDFFTTESNYVGILDTILNLFKNKLEELAETNDALLNKSEIKSIFGNFLPIHEVHQSMLEHLRSLYTNWREDCLIGDIIIQHRDELIKAYPPYVNFYEQMKEELSYCDKEYPRFHAFLKINQTKPECGRQSLQDLMIRPVQRLPSISLLLNDILKHTHNSNPDFARLEEALKAIKEVTMHINEDKRRTESRMAIFDIFNDIEGCPAHLVSSNRSFICKCEVNELSDALSGRGDTLMLYLFSDSIEVCKKRSRGFNTAKSPSSTKSHKHIKLISLNTIRLVIDITDSVRAFGLLQRGEKEKLHTFSITDEEMDKVVYLKKLCMQMAEHACRTDADKMLITRTSQELEVDISDVNLSTLSKAFKLAAKTRLKVGRAFSFNKTPNKLKRAVSTMMTSPFGSTNSLTPASQLAQMRLASCTNIHEVVDEDGTSLHSCSPSAQSEVVIVPPLSVQPTRKNKAAVGRI